MSVVDYYEVMKIAEKRGGAEYWERNCNDINVREKNET
jgi:hypothetical protein